MSYGPCTRSGKAHGQFDLLGGDMLHMRPTCQITDLWSIVRALLVLYGSVLCEPTAVG